MTSAATGSPALDPAACYRAAAGRDPRFDGRVYLAVTTTGIYCRPSCPARTPLQRHCRFFPSAAAAVAAGFRACRRCRPDALPGSRHWDARGDLAARALRLIAAGAADEVGVAGLARRLAVSERHLHRVLVEEVGASPQQLARTRRAQTARMLLEQTPLAMADVAFAAGFTSVRQFNDVVRGEFGTTPGALRRASGPTMAGVSVTPSPSGPADPGSPDPVVELRLRHRAPLALEPLRRFVAGHTIPGLERHDPATGEHTRCLRLPDGRPAAVTAVLAPPASASPGGRATPSPSEHVVVRLHLPDVADLAPVVARVRRWLDLDADPVLVDGALSADPALAPLVAARPGLRVPGGLDGGETALCAVIGQQVSLAAARTFAGRLVGAFGDPGPLGLSAFPLPGVLAAAGPDAVRAATGLTGARSRTVHALATALAEGLVLDPGADRDATRAALLALPGIGPWTADYVALRALGDPDAFLPGDLVLKRILGVGTAAAASQRGEAWRPWRGYALMHLWTQEVFA